MPSFRKLTPEEIHELEWAKSGIRKAIAAAYDNYMQGFTAGDYGEATLEPNEKRMTVMSRLKAAAERHDPPLKLVFRRTNDPELLRFMVLSRDDDESEHSGSDVGVKKDQSGQIADALDESPARSATPVKKRGGRASTATSEHSNGTGAKKGPGRPRKQSAS